MRLPFNGYLAAFVFFATLCSYNFHYLLGNAYQQQKFTLALLYKRYTAVLVLLLGICGALLVVAHAALTPVQVIIAALLTFIYSIPLFPVKALAFTRRAGFVKTLLLAFTWMYVTAYLPLAQQQLEYSTAGILIMAKRFLFMLMLCILFDNRDVKVDKMSGLSSLATHFSPAQMKWLIYAIFALLFLLNFYLGAYAVSLSQLIALQLAALINLLIYFYSLQKQGYFFYYFVVDGSMVLMTLLTTVASI